MVIMAKPFLGDEEKQAVAQVLDSGMIACGAVTTEFEQAFAAYIGAKHGIATTSGTTALEVALRALGIGPGDRVLTTPFSFIASTNSILYAGATPVFADIDPLTLNIDPAAMEAALKADPGIKAVQIVHLFGCPCNMDAVLELKKRYGFALIEDCAQAHGALWKNQPVGSFGDIAAFSFYPTKNMTTSEGGMVLTSRDDLAENARLLINHGMKVRYYHDTIGYNYRMTNLAAAIGLCQLKKLDAFNARRREIAEYYRANIQNPAVQLPAEPANTRHCYHQFTLRVAQGRRDAFLQHLQENEIGSAIFYPLSIPEQKCYAGLGFETRWPHTDEAKEQVVSLPVHPQLTNAEIALVCEVVNRF